MHPAAPTLDQWQALYHAAAELRNLQPWAWMSDADLFAVHNPESGEVGYCCVLGALGEVFALCVYLGAEGLDCYLKTQSGALKESIEDVPYMQKCLMASFEDRNGLENKDLDAIKRLGLRFRGRHAWPQFRSYLPGYVPWHLNRDEAAFLIVVLEQAIDVSQRFSDKENRLTPPEDGLILARSPKATGKTITWRDRWVKLEPPPERELPLAAVDGARLKEIDKASTRTTATWEVDFFYLRGAVKEGERPFFPRVLVLMERAMGIVLDTWLAAPWDFFPGCRPKILEFLEKARVLPRRILVRSKDTETILEPIASGLHISLGVVKTLRAVKEFRAGLDSWL